MTDSEELGSQDAWNVRESQTAYATAGDCKAYYVKKPFDKELGFSVTSVNYDLEKLLVRADEIVPIRHSDQGGESP